MRHTRITSILDTASRIKNAPHSSIISCLLTRTIHCMSLVYLWLILCWGNATKWPRTCKSLCDNGSQPSQNYTVIQWRTKPNRLRPKDRTVSNFWILKRWGWFLLSLSKQSFLINWQTIILKSPIGIGSTIHCRAMHFFDLDQHLVSIPTSLFYRPDSICRSKHNRLDDPHKHQNPSLHFPYW